MQDRFSKHSDRSRLQGEVNAGHESDHDLIGGMLIHQLSEGTAYHRGQNAFHEATTCAEIGRRPIGH